MTDHPQEHPEAKLLAYIEGELDEAGRAEIERHLAANPKHRRLLADLASGRDLLRRLPRESAPPELFDGFQASLERQLLLQPAADINPETGNYRISRWPQIRAAAAAVVLAAGLGVIVYTTLPNKPSDTAKNNPATNEYAKRMDETPAAPADAQSKPFDKEKQSNQSDVRRGMGDNRGADKASAGRASPDADRTLKPRMPATPVALASATPRERAAIEFAMALPELRNAMSDERAAATAEQRPQNLAMGAAPAAGGSQRNAPSAKAQGRDSAFEKADAQRFTDAGRAEGNGVHPAPHGVDAVARQAEPVFVVVASADPTAAQTRLAMELADAGLTDRSRRVFDAPDLPRPGPLDLNPFVAAAPDTRPAESIAAALPAPGNVPPITPIAPGSPQPDGGLPATTPTAVAIARPKPTPAPAPAGPSPAMAAAKPTSSPTAKPLIEMAKSDAATRETDLASAALIDQPARGVGRESESLRRSGDIKADVRHVVVVRRVPRSQISELAARLNRPESAQFAMSYGATRMEPDEVRARKAAPRTTSVPFLGGPGQAGGISAASIGPASNPAAAAVEAQGAPPAPIAVAPQPFTKPLTAPAAMLQRTDIKLPEPAPTSPAPTSPAPGATTELVPPSAVPFEGANAAATGPATNPAAEAPNATEARKLAASQPETAVAVAADRGTASQDALKELDAPIRPGEPILVFYNHIRSTAGTVPPPVTVRPDGTIIIAGKGEFRVADLTPRKATETLNAEFRRQDMKRSVEIRRPTSADWATLNRPDPLAKQGGPQPTTGAHPDPFNLRRFATFGATASAPAQPEELVDVVIVLRRVE